MPNTTRKIILPKPMLHQLPILQSPARFRIAACGRRFGKTMLALTATVIGHGPGQRRRGALDGGQMLWVSPSYPMSNEVWRHLKRATEGAAVRTSEVERRIELPGGGSIRLASADDVDSLRGSGYDGAVIDEAAFCKPGVFSEAVRPSLADRQGWCLLISTPKGIANWFFDMHTTAKTNDDWEAWQSPTSANPIIPVESR